MILGSIKYLNGIWVQRSLLNVKHLKQGGVSGVLHVGFGPLHKVLTELWWLLLWQFKKLLHASFPLC